MATEVELNEMVDRSRRALPPSNHITSSTQHTNGENAVGPEDTKTKDKLEGAAQPRDINGKEGDVHEGDGEADELEAAEGVEEEIRGYLIQPPGRGSLWR